MDEHAVRRARWSAATLWIAVGLGLASPASAQEPSPAEAGVVAEAPDRSPRPGQSLALDTASLATGAFARMHALLEKTIFRVDVLRLQLRVDSPTASRLAQLAAGRDYSESLADSVADVVLRSPDAWARIRFERDIGLGRFVDGILENVKAAERAGIIGPADVEHMQVSLPVWFDFLAERGVLEGDELWYRMRPDSLRTIYKAVDGSVLLDQTDEGAAPTRILLGSYLAPGSDFRERLVRSLLEE